MGQSATPTLVSPGVSLWAICRLAGCTSAQTGSSDSHVRTAPHPCFPESFGKCRLLPRHSLSSPLTQSQHETTSQNTQHVLPHPTKPPRPKRSHRRREGMGVEVLGQGVQGARPVPQGPSRAGGLCPGTACPRRGPGLPHRPSRAGEPRQNATPHPHSLWQTLIQPRHSPHWEGVQVYTFSNPYQF